MSIQDKLSVKQKLQQYVESDFYREHATGSEKSPYWDQHSSVIKYNVNNDTVSVTGSSGYTRPYTLDRPKCMVEVDGISLIDRQLAVLQTEGLEDIVMIGGYKAEMLRRYGVKLKINPRYYETNMVWTLFCAEDELEGEVIVSYGDIVYSREILQSLLQSKADIAVTIDKDWKSYWSARNEYPLNDAETLKLREDETIIEIGQKPRSLDEIEGQYMGLMKFKPDGLKYIKEIFHSAIESDEILSKPVKNAYMTDLLQSVINSGYPVTSVSIHGGWVEIDTVGDLESDVSLERVRNIDLNLY